MYILDSPKTIKTRFAEYLQNVERQSILKIEGFFGELLGFEVKESKPRGRYSRFSRGGKNYYNE